MDNPKKHLFEGVPKQFITTRKLKHNSTSKGYDYFQMFFDSRSKKRINKGQLHCVLCLKLWDESKCPVIKFYGESSGTGNHLEEKHNIPKDGEKNYVKITDMLKPNASAPPEYYFLLWVALHNLPLSKVEGRGFRLLINHVAKAMKVPSRSVLTRRCLPVVFKAFSNYIKSLIDKEVKYYTLAIDIWTDDYQKIPYFAFILHYGNKFEQREILLEIAPFLEKHTGQTISQQIKRIVKDYSLDLNILRVVSDSASNNILSTEILVCDWQPCIAHRINTVVTTALNNNVSSLDILKKCRKIYKFLLFKKKDLDDAANEEANQVIENLSEFLDLEASSIEDDGLVCTPARTDSKSKRIKIDVQTRWNSTYLMLKSVLDLETRITSVLSKHKKRDLDFKDSEILLMKKLLSILQPFYNATLAASKSVMESSVVRLVFEILGLHRHLEVCELGENDEQMSSFLISLKTNLIQKIEISNEMLVSVLLDPYMKDSPYFKNYLLKNRKDAFDLIVDLLDKYHLRDCQQPEQDATSFPPKESWRREFREAQPADLQSENFLQNIQTYLKTNFPASTNVTGYWKMNSGPLSKLAEIILSMPFSSVSPERTFSCAGSIITSKRNCLSPNNVKMLMFINRNYDLCKETINGLPNTDL